MKVLCIIGDIVRSRDIRDRLGLQKKLEKVLKALSAPKKALLSPYTITLGDEFQAVYGRSDDLFHDFWSIRYAIFPVRIRFSIGVGTLTTRINPGSAIGMDGPAFHRARQGIEELKRSGGAFRVTEMEQTRHRWINPGLDLISHASHNWKRNRLLVLERLLAGQDAKAISKAANFSPTAVYKNIRAGALNTVVSLYTEIGSSLNKTLSEA